jgi:hypothetical protein
VSECLPHECELHVHIGGCFHLEDLFDMGREVHGDVDWALFQEAHDLVYPDTPVDPVALFRAAVREGTAEPLRRHYIHGEADGADFERFMTKMNLLICLYRHWRDVLGRESELVRRIVDRHRAEGLRYVEYRAMYSGGASADPGGFLSFHRANAQILKSASGAGFKANYIISVPRWEPQVGYGLGRRLLADNPDLCDTIVGLDFCNVEEGYPPKSARATFEQLRNDNEADPRQQLEVVYHVGEMYFDKSLESAVRWCHEAGQLGARRIGHAIALGLDPEASLGRRPGAHETEIVSERLDQIDYDLRHAEALSARGVTIDETGLEQEQEQLRSKDKRAAIRRPYSFDRIAEIRRRQDFALSALEQLGTVIEICPTSNRVLGGVTDPTQHSMHRLLASDVDVVIGADDPGIFDSTLADEVDWVRTHSGLDPIALDRRLGDPMRFCLRPPN